MYFTRIEAFRKKEKENQFLQGNEQKKNHFLKTKTVGGVTRS